MLVPCGNDGSTTKLKFTLNAMLGGVALACLTASAANRTPTVVVRAAEPQEISQVLSYPALVDAKVRAVVLAELDGVVRKIHSNIGQKVERGTRLFTIQQTDPVFQFAPVASVTPVTGLVSELNVTEGTLVSKGQKLATVTDPRSLKVTIEVPAGDVPLIQSESAGELEIPSVDKRLKLKLVGVSPSVDVATGTATAELRPAPADIDKIRPGMVGKMTFKANQRRGFLVPEDALIQSQNQTFLRLVKDDKATKVPVRVGARLLGRAEITEGLNQGDLVVERTSGYVADGETVKAEQAGAAK